SCSSRKRWATARTATGRSSSNRIWWSGPPARAGPGAPAGHDRPRTAPRPGPRRGPPSANTQRPVSPLRPQPPARRLGEAVRIALFVTCLVDALFPEAGKATVRLLERLGHRVEFPLAQTCCGQMHVNSGYVGDALPLVKR